MHGEDDGRSLHAADTILARKTRGDALPDPALLAAAEAAVTAEWQVGDLVLDLYEVTGVLGEGGMGRVYKVHHRGWNVDLAVKTPRAEIFATASGAENFIREAETWVNLGLHPHTVSCYYVRTLGGIPRVFAEYVEGGSLADWIHSKKLYEGGPEKALERILDIAIQFAWGLHYAHEQGLIHQDVKPANVMLTADGVAKVTDFGLAKARALAKPEVGADPRVGPGAHHKSQVGTNPESRIPNPSLLVSVGGMTPAYCSPEQASGLPLSRATDVWSWAVSVLEMFTGEVTWMAGQVAAEVLAAALESPPAAPAIPRVPPEVARILAECFAEAPDARPHLADIVGVLRQAYADATSRAYGRPEPNRAQHGADSLNNRALSLLDLGKELQAHDAWRSALEADPQHPDAIYNRGLVLWRSAELTDEALLQQLETVRVTHGDSWQSKYHLALVHLERGDLDSTVPLLEQSAVDAPDSAELQSTLRFAQSGLAVGRSVRRFDGHLSDVHAACLSRDGRLALSGGIDHTVRLWEVSSGRCVKTLEGHAWQVQCVCFSPDGRQALSGSLDSTLRLWDLMTAECLRSFVGHTGQVNSVCMSADARWALSASSDKTVRLWDLGGGLVRTFEGHTDLVNSVCLSPDDHSALSASEDGTLRHWDVATGRCLRVVNGGGKGFYSVCFSSDGRRALAGNYDHTVSLWELDTGRCARVFRGHHDAVWSVCLTPDDRHALSAGSDGTVRLWAVATGRCLRTFTEHERLHTVWSVCTDASGSVALSAGGDHTLRLRDVPVAETLHSPLQLSRLWSHAALEQIERRASELLTQGEAALHKDDFGTALARVREARALSGQERTPRSLEMWSALSARCKRTGLRGVWLAKNLEGHMGAVTALCLTRDGRRALSGSSDTALKLWDVEAGHCLSTLKGHKGFVNAVDLSTDGRWAVSASEDRTLRLWDLQTGACVRAFEGHTERVGAVALSRDGRSALSGSSDRTLRLWDVATGRCVRTFKGHTEPVSSATFSGDCRWAISGGGDGTLRLWDLATGRSLRTFQAHESGVDAVSLSLDGRRAFSGGYDKVLRLWQLPEGRCVQTFEGQPSPPKSVCLSPDGRFALSGNLDNTVRLWDTATGMCLRVLEGHTGWVFSVCMSGDGRWIGSASLDGTARLWELDWELESPVAADWDEAARPYLEDFLALHEPALSAFQKITLGLSHRRNAPQWTPEEFNGLLQTLGCAGYGWLRPEGVRRQLEALAASWKGPAPLPAQ